MKGDGQGGLVEPDPVIVVTVTLQVAMGTAPGTVGSGSLGD